MRGKGGTELPASLSARITPAHAGKSARGYPQTAFVGITPAHAGKRRYIAPNCANVKDHPRPCGEKHGDELDELCRQGSPPPMRGKEMHRFGVRWNARITPAHAGKSYSTRS